jgi:hypothetical protein
MQAIPADQRPALDEFYGVVVINNVVQDAGAASVGQTTFTLNNTNFNLAALWFDPMSLSTEFAAHEFGHGLGLNHSFDDSRRNLGGLPGEYCDPWDIMSAQATYQFNDANWPLAGSPSGGGPGSNAPGLLLMGWIPSANQRRFQNEGQSHPPKINQQIMALAKFVSHEGTDKIQLARFSIIKILSDSAFLADTISVEYLSLLYND